MYYLSATYILVPKSINRPEYVVYIYNIYTCYGRSWHARGENGMGRNGNRQFGIGEKADSETERTIDQTHPPIALSKIIAIELMHAITEIWPRNFFFSKLFKTHPRK